MTIAQLNLAPLMAQRATELQAAHPSVVYVSGRRTLAAQARAMAANYLQDPRTYLMRNYVHAATMQTALERHPEITSVDGVAHLLLTLMEADPTLVTSPHLLGDAVDLLPLEFADGTLTPEGQHIVSWIATCPDTVDFRTREGALVRWHWACRHSAEA